MSADWYLIVWVAGALFTWACLTKGNGKRIPPEIFHACIILWPFAWVIASFSGLLMISFKVWRWARGNKEG